ncbi:MAG: hypothetical protein ACLQPH_07575 [Acidimicrobiales bacterium]
MRHLLAVVPFALAAVLTACGTPAAGPQPAEKNPSAISKMVCSSEARQKLGQALGENPKTVTLPTWGAHLYSCTYEFPQGQMTVSVKELSSEAQTTAFFDEQEHHYGKRQDLYGLGQGAFLTNDGSVVARKDYKFLIVDTSGLPSSFSAGSGSGTPAETVSTVIMGCWAGD